MPARFLLCRRPPPASLPSIHSSPVVTSFVPISFRPISADATAEFIALKSMLRQESVRPSAIATVGPIGEWEGERDREGRVNRRGSRVRISRGRERERERDDSDRAHLLAVPPPSQRDATSLRFCDVIHSRETKLNTQTTGRMIQVTGQTSRNLCRL